MKADFHVCFDACVLANYAVCDLFLRLAEHPRLILPRWSGQIMEEVYRTHIEKLKWPEKLAQSYQEKVSEAFPDAVVQGYESFISSLKNDEKDRHVLAAAIKGNCSLIVTFNLKDFPDNALSPWGIKAEHPQDYLLTLYEMDDKRVMSCLGQIAGKREIEMEDLIILLGKSLPQFSARIIDDCGL